MRRIGAEKRNESDVLRAEDIVPGHGGEGPPGPPADVPQYNLGGHLMSDHRRVSATRRTGPGRRGQTAARPAEPRLAQRRERILATETPEQRQVITEIVARDVEALRRAADASPGESACGGHR